MSPSLTQPRALYLLVFVQMWECFSFYGMRALLVLYMLKERHFTEYQAIAIYALYTGLVELSGVVGGMLGDKILGLRKAIFYGGWVIACGHLCLGFEIGFFPGLALIVLGTSLFSSNIAALLGLYYSEQDLRRDSGFTLFYSGINIGAFLASILCGLVGEHFGWKYGFGLAAVGMFVGNLMFYLFQHVLEGKGGQPKNVENSKFFPFLMLITVGIVVCLLVNASHFIAFLPFVSIGCFVYLGYVLYVNNKWIMCSLTLCFISQALFFAAEEQIGSSFLLLAERFTNKLFFGWNMPSSVLLSINPLIIILFGALFARFVQIKENAFIPTRIVFALALAAVSYFYLGWLSSVVQTALPMSSLVISIIVISLAELLIGPAIYSFLSKMAPEGQKGLAMSIIPIGFSLASFLGGHFSTLISGSLQDFAIGYKVLGSLLLLFALMLACGIKILNSIRGRCHE